MGGPEISFGPDDDLPAECAASFDNVHPINRHLLTQRIATLDPARRHELCAALSALADCRAITRRTTFGWS